MKCLVAVWVMMLLGVTGRVRADENSEREIRAVLRQQEIDWNRGDVKAFMRGYAESPDTLFVGSTVTRGWQATLENYQRRYPTRAAMGTLTFKLRDIRMLGANHALVLGEYRLERSREGGGPAQGKFTLTLARTAQGWKILADHTSN